MDQAIVITSIHGITDAVDGFLSVDGWDVVYVADRKTPDLDTADFDDLHYLSLDAQADLASSLNEQLPYNHYSRKNLGYLYAIHSGATRIADTDDDNLPKADWEEWPDEESTFDRVTAPRFPNLYELFTDAFVWPRGYPLSEILSPESPTLDREVSAGTDVGVVQGLADVEPDVDAIYRLVIGEEVTFGDRRPVVLDEDVYSPFNSQNTLWFPEAFTYMYLPTTVEFRFTDILRGYVAQRGLWALGKRLAFRDASVVQERNPHDLLRDFESEIPCYTRLDDVVEVLDATELEGDAAGDIVTLYEALADAGIVDPAEITLVEAWADDIERAVDN